MALNDHKYLNGESLYPDIVTYCNFGDHRTATEVDLQTAERLAECLNQAGFAAELKPYTL